ncbi:MAG: hypothetical protein M2R45_04378 [Verrucomicrobia subdivision 3 bacterium]|nr:hypothetical protein [Limisphaerales bacterium]MCS1416083.1 hypothetical protein [Limisphaerales bacterium]
MPTIKLTYYFDLISSWCHYADLKQDCVGTMEFDRQCTLIDKEGLPPRKHKRSGFTNEAAS